MPQSATWDRRLYFPSEGRRAEDFFALKILWIRPGFEPAKSGTGGQHAYPLDHRTRSFMICTAKILIVKALERSGRDLFYATILVFILP